MTSKNKNNIGATPGKLAVIAILAIVLAVVIASNFGASEAPASEITAEASPLAAEVPTASTANASGPAATATSDTSGNPFGEFATDDNWPTLPISEATTFDPMAAAPWAASSAGGDNGLSDAQISELMAAKNAIILMSGGTRVARIGSQEFRVGDKVGRFRIVDISSQGITLSEPE
ncbi:MAG: hypothetical protein DCC67_02405 [Planctomycetota bacterium]|nr:MAG: hypothetical protein DCC67_02405 [Planctomycetota bacterium]